jgi:hypothetical protein
MAYLYRHIRLDTNQPFYVGIGSDIKHSRAYHKKGRSFSWKDIAYNFSYEVEIMLDDLSWKEACLKEIEFISLYGRKDLGKGTLVNLTDGGEGQFGRKDSIETKIKKSKPKSLSSRLNLKLSHIGRDYSYLQGKVGAKKGVNLSQEHKDILKISAASKYVKVYCVELNIIFNSLTEAGKYLSKSPGSISNILKSKTNKTRDGLTLTKYE